MSGSLNIQSPLLSAIGLVMLSSAGLLSTACTSERQPIGERPSGAVEVRSAIEPATATVGDRLRLTLRIDREDSAQATLPDPLSSFGGLELIDSGVGQDGPEPLEGRTLESYWFDLRAERAGSYEIEPIEVAFETAAGDTGTARSESLTVTIESLLPPDDSVSDIRDIKPLVRIPEPDWRWVGFLAAVIVLLALTLWQTTRRQPAVPEVRLLPHEIAFRELDRLRQTDFENLEALHAYYYSISSVIRTYIESRFGLNATDLTREEIVRALPAVAGLSAPQASDLERFLAATDEVKYAKRLPGTDEIESNYELALGLVEQTAPEGEDPALEVQPERAAS